MGPPAVFSVSTQPHGGGEELEIEWASDLVNHASIMKQSSVSFQVVTLRWLGKNGVL